MVLSLKNAALVSLSICALSAGLFAERISAGLDMNLDREAVATETETSRSSGDTTAFTVKPFVGIRFIEKAEFRPAIGLLSLVGHSQSEVKNTATSLWTSTEERVSQFGLLAELAMYTYLIDKGMFRFLVGGAVPFEVRFKPKHTVDGDEEDDGLEKYVQITFGGQIPANLDFVPSNHIGFRVTASLFDFAMSFLTTEVDFGTPANPNIRKLSQRATVFNSVLTKGISAFGFSVFVLF